MSEDICKELSTLADDRSISEWTDDKRKDFIKLFNERANFGRALYLSTAAFVRDTAFHKKFISERHLRSLPHHCHCTAGDRTQDMMEIAKKRANAILGELPPLQTALQVIDPETARKLDELEKLQKRAQELFDEMTKLSEPIDMNDTTYDDMTVPQFRKFVKGRLEERKCKGRELDDVAEKGTALEAEVHKRLYSGIPGLSDAVVKVIRDLVEREKALAEVTRRIEERVMFGDSQAAMEMLQRFEKDEVTISDDVRAEFRKALDALKVPSKKQLRGRK